MCNFAGGKMKKGTNMSTATQKPYTMEEIHQMVAEGEQQFADGQWQDSEDMFRELEEGFGRENPITGMQIQEKHYIFPTKVFGEL